MYGFSPFIPFLHDMIRVFDIRTLDQTREDVQKAYLNPFQNYMHEVLYFTDLPKLFMFVDTGQHNPYHVLFYMIARFYFVDDGNSDVFYYYPYDEKAVLINTLLENLPLRFKRLTQKMENVEYIQFPGCHWLSDGIREDWIYKYVRDLYKDSLTSKSSKTLYDKIYISRRKSTQRRILNEIEFEDSLKQMGFQILLLEDLSVEAQMGSFVHAKIVVGAHGAGLAWTVFGPDVIIEINTIDGQNHYQDISQQLGTHFYRYYNLEKVGDDYKLDVSSFLAAVHHVLREHQI